MLFVINIRIHHKRNLIVADAPANDIEDNTTVHGRENWMETVLQEKRNALMFGEMEVMDS